MNKGKVGILIGVVMVSLIGIIVFFMDMSVDNKEVKLRNRADALAKANEARYDEVTKTISASVQVNDKYADDFKEVILGTMEGRYASEGQGSPMFKFIKEQNPSIDSAMYMQIVNTVNGQRAGWTRDQKELVEVKRLHDNLLATKPSKWFINDDVQPLEIKIVSSSKVKKVMETGIADDEELF